MMVSGKDSSGRDYIDMLYDLLNAHMLKVKVQRSCPAVVTCSLWWVAHTLRSVSVLWQGTYACVWLH